MLTPGTGNRALPFRNSLFKEPADLKTQHRSNVKAVEGSACFQETQGLGSPDSLQRVWESFMQEVLWVGLFLWCVNPSRAETTLRPHLSLFP